MAANIATIEDLQNMLAELKQHINNRINKDQEQLGEIEIGWVTAKKIEEETGFKAKTLFAWKARGGLFVEGEDYSRVGKLYFWNSKTIKDVLSGKRELPQHWKDSQLSD